VAALEYRFPGVRSYVFGHVGDGNLHYNVGMADAAATVALMGRREEVNRVMYDIVAALGGTISAEHGIGQLKRAELARCKAPLELELMRTLKRALDPQDRMNPGKVL
jgi:FAD/FMN-containing dehydrogenase